MAKIIDLGEEYVVIGMDDGSILEVTYADVNYNPSIGDRVEIFRGDDRIVVTKSDGTIRYNGGYSSHQSSFGVGRAHQSSQQNPGMYGMKLVNKYVYALLAIFFGSIGLHKFYAGKYGSAVLMLLTCWSFIPTIVGFVQGIVALNKPADQ
ncbi:MAG: TM2 domain-containing protein, partial [Bacillota bacterium]|nr:TM2 domain-containing protein [Bacillota bacterium]